MCACGCFVLLAAAGALFYCYQQQLWLPMALIIVALAAIAVFGAKFSNWRPPPRRN
jgi:hypothetical protein